MSKPPFELGDRVDHKKFGLSTVCEPLEGGPNFWKVTIKPDDPSHSVKVIAHSSDPKGKFLRLVETPDEKGERYWRAKYEELSGAVEMASRKKIELLRGGFRKSEHMPFAVQLNYLREQEAQADLELISFMNDDEAGKHK